MHGTVLDVRLLALEVCQVVWAFLARVTHAVQRVLAAPVVLDRAPRAATPIGAPRHPARVQLVGAGPGDPDLLTLKAVRAIAAAEVILYDALVTDDILALASRDAELISVGKRGGRPSCRQGDINARMLAFARAGKRVVRLKSGDPSIFGRMGEEIAVLRAGGIEFEVVPGITAASAMAAALGLSLTDRDHAKSVRFVTGHSKNGGLPEDLDWRAIADASATTVFYMGAHTVDAIAARLIDFGVPVTTPCAVVAGIGRPGAEARLCSLATLSASVRSLERGPPILFAIGESFAGASSRMEGANLNMSAL